MKIEELLDAYVAITSSENQNLINVAFDEMNSSQYEEAASHFDQLYAKDSSDYMSYFFRAYCKSFCGRRGDVYPDSQKLTSAFELACKKAIADKKNLDVNLNLIMIMFKEGMENLAYNAVEEVSVDSNGNTHTSNPTKYKIKSNARESLFALIRDNVDLFKENDELKEFALTYLKDIVDYGLDRFGAIIVSLDPSYAPVLEEKKKKARIKRIIGIVVIAVIILSIISCGMFLSC